MEMAPRLPPRRHAGLQRSRRRLPRHSLRETSGRRRNPGTRPPAGTSPRRRPDSPAPSATVRKACPRCCIGRCTTPAIGRRRCRPSPLRRHAPPAPGLPPPALATLSFAALSLTALPTLCASFATLGPVDLLTVAIARFPGVPGLLALPLPLPRIPLVPRGEAPSAAAPSSASAPTTVGAQTGTQGDDRQDVQGSHRSVVQGLRGAGQRGAAPGSAVESRRGQPACAVFPRNPA